MDIVETAELSELTDAQKYATAALFTLALYRCQDVAWASKAEHLDCKNIWGIPPHLDVDSFDDEEAARLVLDTASWQQFWGWDLIAPEGLCCHVYQMLEVPSAAWFGLVRIVLQCDQRDGGPRVSYDTVSTFRTILNVEGAVNEETMPSASEAIEAAEVDLPETAGVQRDVSTPGAAAARLIPSPSSSNPSSSSNRLQAGPSSVAMSAVVAVLHALVSRPYMPMLEQVTPGAALGPASSERFAYIEWPERKGSFHLAPRVHWYDARGRVALKEMATWLRVPWSSIAEYESSMAAAAWSPEPKAALSKKVTWQRKGLRYLAVGTAAVTGGTLLAITGGLAAPAVAAGVGGVLTATGVGGMAAVGGALTSFVGSTTGAALVMTGLGAAGAAHAGGKVARRLGDVKEFGFRELLDDTDLLLPESLAGSAACSTHDALRSSSASLPEDPAPSAQPHSAAIQHQTAEDVDVGQGEREGEDASAGSNGSGASWDVVPSQAGQGSNPPSSSPHAHDTSQADAPPGASTSGGKWRPPLVASTSGWLRRKFSRKSSEASAGEASDERTHLSPDDSSASRSGAPSTSTSTPLNKTSSSWSLWKRGSKDAPLLPVPLTAEPHGAARLAVTIAIHGWISQPQDTLTLWNGVDGCDSQRFVLVWETQELIVLYNMIRNMITSKAGSYAAQWFIEHFMGAAVVAALALPMTIVGVAGMLDGPWAIVMDRSQKAGILLAHVLMSGCHGDRPVILIGYSMGARLLYYCLKEMSDYNAMGIVEHAVLLGAPVGTDKNHWGCIRGIVGGRLVNGYSNSDWVLGLGFRSQSGFLRMAAGLAPISVAGVENVNLSTIIKGHTDYISQMDNILAMLRLHG